MPVVEKQILWSKRCKDKALVGTVKETVMQVSRKMCIRDSTHCGAVDAAINQEPSGYIRYITDEIKKAIGDETDPYKASGLNVRHSVQEIEKSLCIHNIEEETGLRVVGAMYHLSLIHI